MLLIGNGCISLDEERTQMAIWSIVAAPLIMGNDMRNVSAASMAILTNPHAIAVDQDPLGHQGQLAFNNCPAGATGGAVPSCQHVWARPLKGGRAAVIFVNYATTPTKVWYLGCLGGRVVVSSVVSRMLVVLRVRKARDATVTLCRGDAHPSLV